MGQYCVDSHASNMSCGGSGEWSLHMSEYVMSYSFLLEAKLDVLLSIF